MTCSTVAFTKKEGNRDSRFHSITNWMAKGIGIQMVKRAVHHDRQESLACKENSRMVRGFGLRTSRTVDKLDGSFRHRHVVLRVRQGILRISSRMRNHAWSHATKSCGRDDRALERTDTLSHRNSSRRSPRTAEESWRPSSASGRDQVFIPLRVVDGVSDKERARMESVSAREVATRLYGGSRRRWRWHNASQEELRRLLEPWSMK